MRLHQEKVFIQSSEPIRSQSFGIRDQDIARVIDTLSASMYANPIRAYVREICSNARDSHREAGCPNKPIEITLPTKFSKQIEIKDPFGVGISTRRMNDVFLNYGASTKRNDNKQGGGFGYGNKIWRAISSTCGIVTVYNGIKYHYNLYIDESKLGCASLMEQYATDEHNGTTIIVPVKESDFLAFSQAAVDETQHWSEKHNSGVRPIIHNLPDSVSYKSDRTIMLEGSDWELYHPAGKQYSYTDKTQIIIDGIAYNITAADLDIKAYSNNPVGSLLSKNLNVYFPIGKLSLASNRDTIHFDDKTKAAITNKLKVIIEEIKELAHTKVQEQTDLASAEIFWTKFCEYCTFIKASTPLWNGFKLMGIRRKIAGDVTISFYSHHSSYRRGNTTDKFTRTTVDNLEFSNGNEIFIQDETNSYAVGKRLEKYIAANAKTKSATVLTFNTSGAKEYWMGDYGFEHVPTKLISSLPQHVKEHKVRTPREKTDKPRANRTEINAWVHNYNSYGRNSWEPKILPKDSSGLYIEAINKKTNEYACGTVPTGNYFLAQASEALGQKIYAIKTKDISDLGSDWQRLDKLLIPFVEDHIVKYTEADCVKIEEEYCLTVDKVEFIDEELLGTIGNYISADSPVIKYIDLSNIIKQKHIQVKKIKDIRRQFSSIITTKNEVNTYKESQIRELRDIISMRYPLLANVRYYSKHTIEAVSEYINLIDEKYNRELQTKVA